MKFKLTETRDYFDNEVPVKGVVFDSKRFKLTLDKIDLTTFTYTLSSSYGISLDITTDEEANVIRCEDEGFLNLALRQQPALKQWINNTHKMLWTPEMEITPITTCVKIPGDLVVVPEESFQDCRITSAEIQYGITTLKEGCFYGSDLLSVSIPSTVTRIEDGAFGETALMQIKLPPNIDNLSEYLLYNCGQLESVIIPNKVQSIGTHCFSYCYHLKTVTIPKSVKVIDRFAFYYSGIQSIMYSGTLQQWDKIVIKESTYSRAVKDVVVQCIDGTAIFRPQN